MAVSIERQRLDIESKRVDNEHMARMEDLRLRERELDIALAKANAESKGITAPRATVYGAAATLIGGLIGAVINGFYTSQTNLGVESEKGVAAMQLEDLKFETGLILKAIETRDQPGAVKTLQFFAEAGLIPKHEKKVMELASKDEGASIPTIVPATAVAPAARLHILAIGVSVYGDKATNLRLKFAAKDANDLASALLATQSSGSNKKGSLYQEVKLQYLHDRDADKAAIFEALVSMKNNMAKGAGQDLAVILFSGHGALIDDRFYLLPYDVNARTPAEIKASAISADEFHDEIAELATYGRVLVLLDACHSGAVTGTGSALTSDADVLRRRVSASNVTVLTSSIKNEISREDDKWDNSAFTKARLDALGKDALGKGVGLIWMTQLTHYVITHVTDLTHGQQHPGVSIGYEGEVFIAGQ
jgi:hypothetical protein